MPNVCKPPSALPYTQRGCYSTLHDPLHLCPACTRSFTRATCCKAIWGWSLIGILGAREGGGGFGMGARALWCCLELTNGIQISNSKPIKHHIPGLPLHQKLQGRCITKDALHAKDATQQCALSACAGTALGPTTDPVLIQVQQDFMPDSGHMQQAGLRSDFFAAPQNTLTSK